MQRIQNEETLDWPLVTYTKRHSSLKQRTVTTSIIYFTPHSTVAAAFIIASKAQHRLENVVTTHYSATADQHVR